MAAANKISEKKSKLAIYKANKPLKQHKKLKRQRDFLKSKSEMINQHVCL
ncbi:Hypothetical predicted protein [Podarcis lilfordi]|uniref:Uncharacterized protein n=1 Tax=Podarcis lilfordi TaxID=74358 RepID=A0AA35K4R4_9SAUR|nr:Hypothetical predicted protein [Podarcis lilfordi]